MMTAEQCAEIIIAAGRKRKRQVVMSPGALSLWLKLLVPDWVDKLTIHRFLKPVAKRLDERKYHADD